MLDFPSRFEVIVIGGGHAGTEAALVSARMGVKTLLFEITANPGPHFFSLRIAGIGIDHHKTFLRRDRQDFSHGTGLKNYCDASYLFLI